MLGQVVGDRLDRGAARAGRRGGGSGAAGSAASRRRARRSRSAGGRPRRGRRARGSRLADLVRLRLPLVGELVEADAAGEAGAAVDRDPDHQLRGDVVLGLAARLPDPLVGVAARRRSPLRPGSGSAARSAGVPRPAQRFFVQVDRVEQRAPDVVLALVVGAVADPHRAARRRSRRGGRGSSRSAPSRRRSRT